MSTATLTPGTEQAFTTEQGAATQAPAQDSRGLSIASFVLGIASIVAGWTFLAPIAGLILGIMALRRNTEDRALALWGVWLNGAMLALTVLAVVIGAVFLGLGLMTIPFLG